MGAREDFMTMRRAALVTISAAQAALLFKASCNEAAFIRLTKAGIQAEVIDLAYAVLGEERPGGPATQEGDDHV